MGDLNKIKSNKYLILDDLSQAEDVLGRFPTDYTVIDVNDAGDKYAIYIRPTELHKLTQSERDIMQELPSDFYGNIE